MRKDLMLAHLRAMSAAIDALIFEVAEDPDPDGPRCCARPVLQRIETYGGGSSTHCTNCGTSFKEGPEKTGGEH